MHFLLTRGAFACLLFGALATGALAQQDVPFTTLAQGGFAPGAPPAGQHVIRSQQELSALGLDQAISTPIDWASETVVAVFAGTKPSGGYGISIDRITHEQLATILPVPAPPPSYLNTVYVSESAPSGPAITVLTSPFHVVKLRALPGRYSFATAQPQPPAVFAEVKLSTQTYQGAPGGQFPWTREVTVEASGAVSVLRSHPAAFVVPIYGQATPAELRRLEDAVRGARLSTVPDPLDVMIPMHLIAEPFRLHVSSTIGVLAGRTSGQFDYYGHYDAKLRPLIDTVGQISARLVAEYGTQAVRGRVRISGGEVVIQAGSERYAVQGADMAATLRQFRGRTVEVRGRANQIGGSSYQLDVARIVNPEPLEQGLIVSFANGDAKVYYDGGERLTEGPLSYLLRRESGRRVTLRGYAFRDAAGAVESVFVDQVRGTATGFVALTHSGQWAGYLRAGDEAWIQRLSFTRRYGLVEGPTGTGYARLSSLQIGAPVPLHTGMSGALGGN
ncbi:MAG: protease complex subunit PrcB family protein [Planctomycetota bacterium]